MHRTSNDLRCSRLMAFHADDAALQLRRRYLWLYSKKLTEDIVRIVLCLQLLQSWIVVSKNVFAELVVLLQVP